MFINHVRGHNFKGQSFEQKLGPMTLISGDNFAGKSTLTDAIRLALAGYLPAVGKSAGSLWGALAGNPEREGTMEVAIGFDTWRTSKLAFARSKKGAVSVEGAVPADLALDPMLLDVRQFFGMTAAQRTAVIFGASGAKGIVAEELVEKLGAIQASPATVRDTLMRRITEQVEAADADVDRLLADWKETLKAAKANHKVAAGAFAGMTLPLRIPTKPTGIAELAAKRDALTAKRGELAALLRQDSREAQLREAVVRVTANLTELRTAAAELQELPEESPERPGLLDDYELAKDEIESTKERIAIIREDYARLTAELNALAGVTICPHCGETGGVERARTSLRTRLREAHDSEADAVQKLEEASAPFMDLKTVTAEWQEAMREFDDLRKQHENAQRRITETESVLAKSQAELDGLVGNRAAQVEKLTAEVAELPEVEKELDEAQAAKVACDEYKKLVEQRTKREEQALALACEVEVYTQAITALNEHVAKRGEEAFGKVLQLSDAFTKGLLNSPLEFRDGELGRRVSKADRDAGITAPIGAWISRESFSGTEELLAMAGFGVALARMAPFVLVILDEMGRLTTERRKAVATRMLELIQAGTVHQVIMIDPEPDGVGYPDEAVRVYV